METITLVLNARGKTRRVKVGGNDFLVVPATLIVPGVLPGSHGPLFYPPEEILNSAHAWNGVPVVVNHPFKDGLPISARNPEVFQSSTIGAVYNANASPEDPVLRAEAWLNVAASNRVDPRVVIDIESGRNVEISTGLGLDEEAVPAGTVHNTRNGPVEYRAVARNYRPDHLAILLDSKGACSLADGCGIRLNKHCLVCNREPTINPSITNAVTKTVGGESLSAEAFAYVPDPSMPSTWKLRIDDAQHVGAAVAALGKGFRGKKVRIPRSALAGVKKKVLAAWKNYHPDAPQEQIPKILTNAAPLSHADLREQLCQALCERYSEDDPEEEAGEGMSSMMDDMPMVLDVYDKEVVFMYEMKCWKLGYTTDLRKGSVELSPDDPVEVRRVISYKEVTNSDNETIKRPEFHWQVVKEGDMDRKATIEFIVANCDCWNKPGDNKVLEGMSDDQLGRVHAAVKKGKEAAVTSTTTNQGIPVAQPVTQPAGNVILTPEMLTKLVGDITTGVIANVRNESEKTTLVATLLANAPEDHRPALTVTYNSMTVEQLRPLAALVPSVPSYLVGTVPPMAANFGPAAGVPNVVNTVVDQDDTLPDPDYSFLNQRRARNGSREPAAAE